MLRVLAFSVAGQQFIGLQEGKHLINFSHAWGAFKYAEKGSCQSKFNSITEMIELGIFSGKTFKDVLKFLNNSSLLETYTEKREVTYEVPIYRPGKILALARNSRAHARELGNEPVEEPIIFAKTVNTMLPHNGEIIFPKELSRVDHEIELGVVIGKKAKNITVEEADEFIAGYTVVNDVTARDMQKTDMANQWPWLRSKNFDTFLPIGPYIVPKEFINDPGDLGLILTVNGEKRQHGNTGSMINPIPVVISYISRFMTLSPGDIICTGTPEGVSPLKVGDVVSASIENIGTLVNKVCSS